MATQVPLRRRPVQQRSAKRVEQMLEACAALIEELGYDGVTTTLIADRAGVAVGSLYQFFPDKRAVVQALTQRNLENFLAEMERRLDESRLENWWDGADLAFDIYVRMYREVPGFSRIRFGDVVDLRLIADERDNNTVLADGLAELTAKKFGIPMDQVRLPIAVAIEMADGILDLAFRRKQFPVEEMITEARTVVRAYLSGRLAQEWKTM